MAKTSEVYTVHEMKAPGVLANKNCTNKTLAFEEWYPEDDGDGNANVPQRPHWASKMEVWGNYELNDGDMVHGWVADNHKWDAFKPDFEARVHGDGIFAAASALGKTRDAQSMPTYTLVPAMELAPGAPLPPPATQRASRVGDRTRSVHTQSMPTDTSVPSMALAPGAPPPQLQHRVHQGLATGT